MHHAPSFDSVPIRSRGQLELELARLGMRIRHACGQLSTSRLRDTGRVGAEAIGEWFSELADELIARTDTRLVAYAKERLKALAARWRIVFAARPTAALHGAARRIQRPASGAPLQH
jgi:hypothetical protein